jgi:hypothetical protein
LRRSISQLATDVSAGFSGRDHSPTLLAFGTTCRARCAIFTDAADLITAFSCSLGAAICCALSTRNRAVLTVRAFTADVYALIGRDGQAAPLLADSWIKEF